MNITDDQETKEILDSSRFWVQRVFVPILVFVGLGGNVITVMVLTRRRMRSTTNIYLTALAMADVVYLLFVLLLSFENYPNIHDKKYALYWRFYGLQHWLCDAASSTSVWLTVSFTLERYIAVCHPIKGKVLCTENRAKSIIVLVSLLCILTTASTTFEYQLDVTEDCTRFCNMTDSNRTETPTSGEIVSYKPITGSIEFSNLRLDRPNVSILSSVLSILPTGRVSMHPKNCSPVTYVPYINAANQNEHKHLLLKRVVNDPNSLVPTGKEVKKTEDFMFDFDSDETNETTNQTAVILNGTCCEKKTRIGTEPTNLGSNLTYITVMSWYSAISFGLLPLVLIAIFNSFLVSAVYRSQKRRKRMTSSKESILLSNENRITLMLISVIVLFLLCQIPTASHLIYRHFNNLKDPRSENISRISGIICNGLLALNASSNFLLYCVLSKKYRTTFRTLFCDRKKNFTRSDTIALNRTRTERFDSSSNGIRRNGSEYLPTPRNLETQSMTSLPRSRSLMARPPGKARTSDIIV